MSTTTQFLLFFGVGYLCALGAAGSFYLMFRWAYRRTMRRGMRK